MKLTTSRKDEEMKAIGEFHSMRREGGERRHRRHLREVAAAAIERRHLHHATRNRRRKHVRQAATAALEGLALLSFARLPRRRRLALVAEALLAEHGTKHYSRRARA